MRCDRAHMPGIKTFPFTDDRKTAKQRHQNQQDHSSTAASLPRGHLTMLSTSTSDMISPLTRMQIYNPPWASLPFHHGARHCTAATITSTKANVSRHQSFYLAVSDTCMSHLSRERPMPFIQTAQRVSVFLGSASCLLWRKKGPESSSGSVRSSTSTRFSIKRWSTQALSMFKNMQLLI